MDRRFVVCALAAAALLLSGCGIGRQSAEEQAREAALVERRLDAQSFRVEIESMTPLRGPRQILTTPYAVIVHDLEIDSHLPYRGQAYQVPYGGGKVLTFKDKILQYRDYPGRDRRCVDIVVDNEEDVLLYQFEFFPGGKATLHVSARNREAIDYTGRVNPEFDPAEK